jgi:hypothetical protein
LSWEKYLPSPAAATAAGIDQEGQVNRDAIFHVTTSKGGLYK